MLVKQTMDNHGYGKSNNGWGQQRNYGSNT